MPHLRASCFCVAVYLAAVALIWPVVELATNDDFAYARTARAFAQTGHFVYNGWETAMLGWQVVWGALFIRLFGYSYLSLRISSIVLGAALAFLLHRMLLRAGVTGKPAVLGTLTVVLSPLFLPVVTGFMSDIPAMLCLAVCLYGCQRALRAANDSHALAWLCGSAALNVLDGTVRQIVWLGTLVMVPSAFWLLRDRKHFKAIAAITWTASVIGIVLLMRWFARQPYSLPEHIINGPITWMVPWRILRISVYGVLEVLCFSLPVFAAWTFDLRTISRRRRFQGLALAAAVTPIILVATHYNKIQGRLPPWSPNIVSRYGILWSTPLLGDRPVVLNIETMSLLFALLGLCLAGFISWLRSKRRFGWSSADSPLPLAADTLTLRENLVLILPFCAAYYTLLFPRAAFPALFSGIYDRYYLPLIMLAVIVLLRLLVQDHRQLPVTCYAILVLFSFFGIAATHDVFIAYRAALSVRQSLVARGIAPTRISGPWEEDGAQQIDLAGYVNDDRLQIPAGAYHSVAKPPLDRCAYWWGPLIPNLHPRYVLTVEHMKCLEPSQFPDVYYRTWLPPFQRPIYIQINPDEP